MSKKININTSVPAFLSDFTTDASNEQFSRAKLKVFYVGETADKRLFTESFAKEVVKTLPYTPVVSKYDVEKDDFVGHAEQQNIYGIVDPCKDIVFEEIDGQTWAIAEVVLYTERPDDTGAIAKKIVGKPHSLELNPKTVQYKINYDKYRKLKNIEFTSGSFVGVSVLGDDQQPAFTGSAFFAVDTEFSKKMDLLKDYLKNSTEDNNRMTDRELNFVELSWGDAAKSIYKALDSRYGAYNTQVIEFFNDYCISYVYHEETGEIELCKIFYSVNENGEYELGEAKKVRICYEEVEEAPAAEEPKTEMSVEEQPTVEEETALEVPNETDNVEFNNSDAEGEETAEENSEAEENVVSEEDNDDAEDEGLNFESQTETVVEETETVTEEVVEPVIETPVEEPVAEPIQEEGNNFASDTSTSFEGESEELKALERQKKLEIIASYDNLDEEVLSKYQAEVDNFTESELEIALLKATVSQMSTTTRKPVRVFKTINDSQKSSEPTLEELVKRYVNK